LASQGMTVSREFLSAESNPKASAYTQIATLKHQRRRQQWSHCVAARESEEPCFCGKNGRTLWRCLVYHTGVYY